MEQPIVVVVEADDFSVRADAEGSRRIKSTGKVNCREIIGAQQKAVVVSRTIIVVADDLSFVVDPSGHRGHCAWKVDGGEIARTHQKTVGVSRRVVVGANDLAQIIHPLKKRAGSAGKVKDRKGAVL